MFAVMAPNAVPREGPHISKLRQAKFNKIVVSLFHLSEKTHLLSHIDHGGRTAYQPQHQAAKLLSLVRVKNRLSVYAWRHSTLWIL